MLWGMVEMGFLEDKAQGKIAHKGVNGLESKVGGFEEDDIERTIWAVGVTLKKFGNAGEGSGGEVEKERGAGTSWVLDDGHIAGTRFVAC